PARPGSTLFPYTTLFRSPVLRLLAAHPRHELADALRERHLGVEPQQPARQRDVGVAMPDVALAKRAEHLGLQVWFAEGAADQVRSEEHTSELQSRFDLVC